MATKKRRVKMILGVNRSLAQHLHDIQPPSAVGIRNYVDPLDGNRGAYDYDGCSLPVVTLVASHVASHRLAT